MTYFKILGPPLYLRNGRRYKLFGRWIDDEEAYPKIAKLCQLGTGPGSRHLL